VTGGASFIGSHLVDRLASLGAKVTVVDNLSSGSLENLSKSPSIKFVNLDLEYGDPAKVANVFRGNEVVFHLAADHGGRGYIDSHPANVCSNLSIDHHTFEASFRAGVEKVVFASSACVYPPSLQADRDSDYLLREEDSQPTRLHEPLSADLEYGWCKLMGEMQLNSFIKQYGLKGCSLRFVTAYGERENETHAIIALIHKAHERMDPFMIWGDGQQSRDFTYVGDIVDGTILAAERIGDGTQINLGTGRRFKVREVAEMILEIMNFHPRVMYDLSKPTGVMNRALCIDRAKALLGWEPKHTFREGLDRTINWYTATHTPTGRVREDLLIQRIQATAPIQLRLPN